MLLRRQGSCAGDEEDDRKKVPAVWPSYPWTAVIYDHFQASMKARKAASESLGLHKMPTGSGLEEEVAVGQGVPFVAYFDKLPPELLLDIINMDLDQPKVRDRLGRLGVLREVCMRWESLIDATPSFWTNLTSTWRTDLIQEAFLKSDNQPLSLSLGESDDKVIEVVLPRISRIKSVTVDFKTIGNPAFRSARDETGPLKANRS